VFKERVSALPPEEQKLFLYWNAKALVEQRQGELESIPEAALPKNLRAVLRTNEIAQSPERLIERWDAIGPSDSWIYVEGLASTKNLAGLHAMLESPLPLAKTPPMEMYSRAIGVMAKLELAKTGAWPEEKIERLMKRLPDSTQKEDAERGLAGLKALHLLATGGK
jgi:hypothetical protein